MILHFCITLNQQLLVGLVVMTLTLCTKAKKTILRAENTDFFLLTREKLCFVLTTFPGKCKVPILPLLRLLYHSTIGPHWCN